MLRNILFFLLFSYQIIAQSIYYVSSSQGNDSNNGLTPDTPWKTITKVNSFNFIPGDVIKFRCEDEFSDATLDVNRNGTAVLYISFSSYGTGAKPVIGDSTSTTQQYGILVMGNYITIENLKINGSLKTNGFDCIRIAGDNAIVRNCVIVGTTAPTPITSGIIVQSTSSGTLIEDNDVSNVGNGISVYAAKPCIIKNNYVHDIFAVNSGESDGIRVVGGSASIFDANYEVLVTGNEVTRWSEDGIDLAYASNVIVEHNELHNPLTDRGNYSTGNGIKMGDWIDASNQGSNGNIFRYNIIHDLWPQQRPTSPYDWYGLAFNGETITSAKVYYNLVYNIYGAAIKRNGVGDRIPTDPNLKWEVYNNTFIAGSSAIQIWGNTKSPTYLYNNIVKSGVQVAGHSYIYQHPRNATEMAQVWHGTDSYDYPTTYDIRYQPTSLIGRMYVDANILVKSGSIHNTNNSLNLFIGQTKGNLYATNPLFNDESNNDYTLTELSPANNFSIDVEIDTDLYGSFVSEPPDAGAIEYGSSSGSLLRLNTKILLEGPFNNGNMSLTLNGVLPLSQPYNSSPWNYNGNESVASVPQGVVDWVLLELRTGTAASTTVARKAALLKSDGSIVNLDGISKPSFNGVSAGNYYIVIRHRNHLSVMSDNPVPLSSNSTLYDFTTGPDKAFGSSSLTDLGNSNWGMFAGDGDINGLINVIDYGTVGNHLFETGYKFGDLDLNGVINVMDYGKTNLNLFKNTQVPN